MNTKNPHFKRLYPDNVENKPIMINFVLSQFLDGVQIWKKKVAHLAPYLINVLNLPPTYRGKLGLGMFLISLIVSLYESLPPYVDKTDINDSQLQIEDKTPQDLLNDVSALLASFINCGLTIVTTNELEYREYTTVPPLKEGISY